MGHGRRGHHERGKCPVQEVLRDWGVIRTGHWRWHRRKTRRHWEGGPHLVIWEGGAYRAGGRGPWADGGMGGGKGTKSGRGGRKLGAGEFENVVEGALGGSY